MDVNWSPEHPLAIGFSVLDALPARANDVHPMTPVFRERLKWRLNLSAPFLKENSTAPAGAMFAGQLHGIGVGVNLTEAPRHEGRSQWRIHVTTQPPLAWLADFQQDVARMLLRELTELCVAWEEVEDVEVVGLD